MRAIKQRNPVEEGHLAQLLSFLVDFDLDLYFDLGRSTIRATCLFMLPVTAYGAALPSALLRFMPPLPAAEAFNLPWVTIHEDRHFYRSVGAGNEGC